MHRTTTFLLLASLAAFGHAAVAADTPRAGWYTDRTQMSSDGQRWQDMPRGPEGSGFCVLGLGEAELEQLYRRGFARDNCQLQQLRIGGGTGSAVAVCQANGYPVRLQMSGRYSSDRFEGQGDSQGSIVAGQGAALPFRVMSRTQAVRVRDCTAPERQTSEQAVAGEPRR